MVIYRLKQLYSALFPTIRPQELMWVQSVLNEKEQKLFLSQLPTEQRHALDVAFDIEQQRIFIEKQFSYDQYIFLLKAALLHDCGKSMIRLRLWQRIFIVLAGKFPLKMKTRLFRHRSIFGKTLLIYQNHPLWGRRLVSKAGVSPAVQTLIQNHHTPNSNIEQILYHADNRH